MCWAASQAGDSEMNQTKKPVLRELTLLLKHTQIRTQLKQHTYMQSC